MSLHSDDSYIPEFVEFDPTGRYGRYNEILGKGASKIVAFDEYEGIEVAWNQVKLYDFLQSPDDLERLYCEIHLLKTLKHKNIMKFYASWVDISKRNINFVTEMFTSGTLRQYRKMHRRVHIRAIKHWCRQILMGLLYLHSHDPPIIHRDLKCENIFINGNQGEVKIGDLGLAAILRKSHAVHCVGTPEFMAPEVYEEEYNELVDIYSFGMCVLEMVTFEYPYSECKNPAQIYKKVISGVKPDALYRVRDPEVRKFIEKCLATASQRLSAKELLMDHFLQSQDPGSGCWEADVIDMGPIFIPPSYNSESSNDTDDDNEDIESTVKSHGIDLFDNNDDDDDLETYIADVDISIKGKKDEDGGIFIRLKIGDKEGHMRNVYFPFDIEEDTALEVAAEMVDELDITDHEVTRIAEMIDGEVSLLVPNWKNRMGVEYVHSNTDSSPSTESNFEFPKLHEQFEDVRAQLEEVKVQKDSITEPNAMKKSEENEKKSPRDPREMNIMYQMRAKGSRKGSLASRSCRNPNLALDLDVIKKYDEKNDKIQNPTPIQSFHLSRNSSCKRPDSEIEQSLSSNSAAKDEEMNQDVLEKIFPKNSCYVGEYLPASLPRARSLCI